jgi:molecular chaperone GrpE (heat shock protein)
MNCPYCGNDSVTERTLVSKKDYFVDNYYCVACDKDFTSEAAIQLSQSSGLRLDFDDLEDEDLFEWPSEVQPESDREFLLKDEVQNLLREVDYLNLKVEKEDRKILNLEADFDDFRRRMQMRSALSIQEFLSSKMPALPDFLERKAEEVSNNILKDKDPEEQQQINYEPTNLKALL